MKFTNYITIIIIFLEVINWFSIQYEIKKTKLNIKEKKSSHNKKLIKEPIEFIIIRSLQLLIYVILNRFLNEPIKINLIFFSLFIISDHLKIIYINAQSKEIMKLELKYLVNQIRENIYYNSISYEENTYSIKIKSKEKEINYFLNTDRYEFKKDFFIDRKELLNILIEEFDSTKKENNKKGVIKQCNQVKNLIMK